MGYITHITVRSFRKDIEIPVKNIILFKANQKYVDAYTNIEGKPVYMTETTLKEYEELLDPATFIRIHRGHIININFKECFHTVKMKTHNNYYVCLAGIEDKLKIGKTYYNDVVRILKQ